MSSSTRARASLCCSSDGSSVGLRSSNARLSCERTDFGRDLLSSLLKSSPCDSGDVAEALSQGLDFSKLLRRSRSSLSASMAMAGGPKENAVDSELNIQAGRERDVRSGSSQNRYSP